jgi:hypothetical protein
MVPRKQAGHMTCTRPQAERQILLATRASSTHDPEQKSAVVGFRGNRIQVIAGRPWRSTTDKRRLASGNCRPSPGAGHGVLRAAPAGARAADHQGPFRPLASKAPASRQRRPNRRIFEDAASDRASNLRSAATSLHCHVAYVASWNVADLKCASSMSARRGTRTSLRRAPRGR